MKKIKFLFILLMPFMFASADEIEDEKVINEFNTVFEDKTDIEDTINGSNAVFANNITSSAAVKGIDMLFGNIINYKGIDDYSLFAGNNIDVNGVITNDGLILGNIIKFGSDFSIGRDLFIFGNSVVLNGNFDRDVKIFASDVTFEQASIKGNVTVYAENIKVQEASVIAGTLSHNDTAKVDVPSTITNIKVLETPKVNVRSKFYSFFIDYAQTMVIFLVLALSISKLFKYIDTKFEKRSAMDIISDFGIGMLTLIIVPIVIFMIFATRIGIPLAIVALLIYIIFIILSTIFTGYLIGYYINSKLIKKENNVLITGLIGISIIKVLSVIPMLSFIVSLISVTLGIGIILRLFRKETSSI